MAAATRINDETSGVCDVGDECCAHGRNGICMTGSNNVLINGRKAHRRGDSGDCRCPHGGSFITTGGSRSVYINGKAATRIGDGTTCQQCGMGGGIISGSANVFIGG